MTPIDISVFNGGWNLPLWAAQTQGFFRTHGLNVSIHYTPSSAELVKGFHDGVYPIVFCSADNVIAYQGDRAEVPISGIPDARIFLSVDFGFLYPVLAPNIDSVADLKGRTLGVDKKDTGFAFVLYEILARAGVSLKDVEIREIGSTQNRLSALIEQKCHATLLRPPYQFIAELQGCSIVRDTGFEPTAYQGTVGVVKERWASDHAEVLGRFLEAYQYGLTWVIQNPEQAITILSDLCGDLSIELARTTYLQLTDNMTGFDRGITPKESRLVEVLRLRNAYSFDLTGLQPLHLDLNSILLAP